MASAKPAEIVAAVREAGLVGLGGAMFPTWVKLAQESGIDTVLVNASESEPFVCCDQRVLLEHRAEVECGMEWIRRAVGADDAKIVATGKGYPYGHESLLIAEVLGREVPRGGRARDVGVTVCNVQTARAVHAALCHGRPLIERVITVDGAAVGAPGNYLVALGTPIHHILDACRTDLARISLLLAGGPMMGCEVELDASLAPGSAAILALGAGEHDAMVAGPCIRCGRCLEACPLDLPAGLLVQRPDARALECIECGVCEFTCVAARPLVDELRRAKAELRGEGRDEP